MLRPGSLSDIPAIADVLIRSWQEHYRHFLPDSFLDNLNLDHQIRRHSRIMKSGTTYWVAENEQQQLCGFASYGPDREAKLPSSMELYTIYVDASVQNKGIGQGLLDRVISDIQHEHNGLAVLVMEVNPYRRFYEKNGFVSIGREKMELAGNHLTNIIYLKEWTRKNI
ncbi:MAG: GNAT family N-acetyltransferase [Bacteroidota bacterium]